MSGTKEYIAAAMVRLLSGNASETEREEIRRWISGHPELNPAAGQDQAEAFLIETYHQFMESEGRAKEEAWTAVVARLNRTGRTRITRRIYISMAAAACFLLIISAAWLAGLFGKTTPKAETTANPAMTVAPIPPARQGAILTLADGRKVQLDSAGGGLLGRQGPVTVIKSGYGELKYLDSGSRQNTRLAFNKLTTPKGRQFKVDLPDGSRVWLNAESSLEYPVAFSGNRREVKLEGEAYFEVAHDKERPFFVNIANREAKDGEPMTIQVLGTSFNAMAYPDESEIQTTLLEGAVRVSKGKRFTGVQPGEAATVSWWGDQRFSVKKVDIDKVMSWKNGMFKYTQTPLSAIMRDIARWYDVDVRYEGTIPDLTFDGSVSRSNSLDKMLQILALNHVGFRMEGRTIVVTR